LGHAARPDELPPLQGLCGPLHRGRLQEDNRHPHPLHPLRDEEGFRAFVSRCNLEDLDKFDRSMAQWTRGSNYANLTEQQYAKLCSQAASKHL
jgi:hypothetical protein